MADEDGERREFLDWASNRHVSETFAELRAEALEIQGEGYFGLPDDLTSPEVRVLRSDLDRLEKLAGGRPVADRAAAILVDMEASPDGRRHPEWNGHEWMLRGRDGRCDPVDAVGLFRHHAIAQAMAMDARAWSDPARALLYVGLNHALHSTYRDSFDRREPKITEKFISKIETTFDGRILRPLKSRSIEVPGKRRLDLGTASMQEDRDLLAADLALAIGIRICGREMYRVVLLQAKNPDDDGNYDVSSKIRSAQIDKFLSTGMGWYLFYPNVNRERPFIATVRPAADIFREVFAANVDGSYRAPFNVGQTGHTAWELATFVCTVMASENLHIGRLFPDVQAAADALSVERKRPLAKRVFVADLTGALNAHVLVGKLTEQGYRDGKTFPVAMDSVPSDKGDDAPVAVSSRGRKG